MEQVLQDAVSRLSYPQWSGPVQLMVSRAMSKLFRPLFGHTPTPVLPGEDPGAGSPTYVTV